jgi:hypothetical protein
MILGSNPGRRFQIGRFRSNRARGFRAEGTAGCACAGEAEEGDGAARWGRCASERRLRCRQHALSCGTAWTDTRGHIARERSMRASGLRSAA